MVTFKKSSSGHERSLNMTSGVTISTRRDANSCKSLAQDLTPSRSNCFVISETGTTFPSFSRSNVRLLYGFKGNFSELV